MITPALGHVYTSNILLRCTKVIQKRLNQKLNLQDSRNLATLRIRQINSLKITSRQYHIKMRLIDLCQSHLFLLSKLKTRKRNSVQVSGG